MKGKIIKMEKLEIWEDGNIENIDMGGYCEICKKRFERIKELIKHFLEVHN